MGLKVFIRKLVAQNKSEITQKAIDVYSISHVLMGIISYGVFWAFLSTFLITPHLEYVSIISVLFWAVIWEYVENFMLLKTKTKKN